MISGLQSRQAAFLDQALNSVPKYLESLRDPARPGRFYPCARGLTPVGEKLTLGFSSLALKNYYILGLWDRLDNREQREWIDLIKSFQVGAHRKDRLLDYSFLDRALVADLDSINRKAHSLGRALRHPRTWWRNRGKANPLSLSTIAVIAETKQAISTLLQVGEKPDRTYTALLAEYPSPVDYIKQLDWGTPWRAGGQAAAVVVFIKAAGDSESIDTEYAASQLSGCNDFFTGICDPSTGSYFTGNKPNYTQLVNGAMKVLTALDWLEAEIRIPERLIDTVLSSLPEPGGCHLVDSVYVLCQCLKQVEYRREDAIRYCEDILNMLEKHYNTDGGFSYYTGRSADTYYGVKYGTGPAVSDLHGTMLLSWSIAMILEILAIDHFSLKNIKP